MSSALLPMAAAAASVSLLWPLRSSRRLAAAAGGIVADRVTAYSASASVEPAAARRRGRAAARRAVARDLPLALDLVAVCCAAGSTPATALAFVGRALPGQLGEQLVTVSRALDLGASGEQAWASASLQTPVLREAAERFAHAERSGASLAPALAALADEQRRLLQLDRAARARRVGVLAAGPLGLCFLPAFVLTGVLPVVIGLVSQLTLS